MVPSNPPRRIRQRVFAVLAGLALVGLWAVVVRPWRANGPPDVETQVALLRLPINRAELQGHMVPGGYLIKYSGPMHRLIDLGDEAREPLHSRLTDRSIRNEVALVLGSIGDESTVPLLIDAFPDPPATNGKLDYEKPDPDLFANICFISALRQLTGHSFGEGRFGIAVGPETKQEWRDWWAKSHKTFWIRDRSPKPNVTRRSVPEVLVQLDAALADPDPQVRTAAARGYAHFGPQAKASVPLLIAALQDNSSDVREAVTSAFYWIGPDGEDAIPALLDLMRNDPVENVRRNAEMALSKIGLAALPPLLELLFDETPELRSRAIAGIGSMEPRQMWILPTFHKLAKDPDPDVRYSAFTYMRVMDEDDQQVFAALLNGLKDPAPTVRRGCAYNLGRMRTKASSATGPLFALLKDVDPGVRRETLYAFDEIRSLSAEHVPGLTAALRDETWEVRSASARLLSKIGPDARPAVDALCKCLSDPQGSVRWWSVEALGAIGPEAQRAVPLLVRALEDPEHLVQSMAGDALKKIDPATAARVGVN